MAGGTWLTGVSGVPTQSTNVGATTLLMAERPTPDATFKRWLGGVGGARPTVFYGAPTGFAGMLASPNLPARAEKKADTIITECKDGSEPVRGECRK